MEELYKIGERTQQNEMHEVEMSDFEKKLNFTKKQQEEYSESESIWHNTDGFDFYPEISKDQCFFFGVANRMSRNS